MFEGAVNAWRNASLDSVNYSMQIEIGDRSNFLLPAIFPRIGKFFNDWLVRPVKAVGGLVLGADAKEVPPAPPVPETFKGTSLETGLKQAYDQKCAAVDASAKKMKCYLNLDFSGARQQEAVAAHDRAMDRIALPENYEATAGVSAAKGTLVGGIADSNAMKGLAAAAVGVMTGNNLSGTSPELLGAISATAPGAGTVARTSQQATLPQA